MAVCRRLWTEEAVEHHGEFWDFESVAFEPKPIQSPLPIHMGGESVAALRRTAEYGNGWLAHRHTRETIQSPLERLGKALDKVGRTLDEIQISVARDPESLDDAAQWDEMGINRLIVFPDARKTGGDVLRALEVFAEQFIEPANP
jgi:alkanesulfonate monooxygenase SsuD/methylene tetrahydromethanopterin reductase-like flavin-dependent oxidoreductase (luciferase family)